MVNAEIVSVGTELLLGQTVDTNANALALLLAEIGIGCRNRQTVGDNLGRLTEALKTALDRADVVITIGGLGPTQDDLTRDGIAAALGEAMVVDEGVAERLRRLFAQRNLPWVESQIRQAMRPPSGSPIDNPNGTAPGLFCRKNGKTVIAMPGPPAEFVPMLQGPVREALLDLGGGGVIHSRTLRISGMGESIVEDRLRDLMDADSPTVAPYAKTAEVHIRVTARAENIDRANTLIEPVLKEIRSRLGRVIYGADETTLEEAVLSLLRTEGATLAVAESCTGGLLGGRLTSVAGSSDVFMGGAITYTNEMKVLLLGVESDTLERHGAVSPETAGEMARGAKERFGSDYAISITGIAGPGGGTDEKPVGLVYIGVAGPQEVRIIERRFRGLRQSIRTRSTQAALDCLREMCGG
ncbi:MAG: competence/damage-inducible protein A [Fimbriimonadaceae bacterium]|nr:competence/damage-inducible protein A [Fimbriimonadaceae bacterium]